MQSGSQFPASLPNANSVLWRVLRFKGHGKWCRLLVAGIDETARQPDILYNKGKTMNLVLAVGKMVVKMRVALARVSPNLGLAVGISLMAAACASDPAPQAVSASAATDGKVAQNVVAQSDRQICRSEKRTGTNFPNRVCFTPEQWNEIDRKQTGDAHSFTDNVVENAGVANAKNCGQSGQIVSC